jgi:hypothetical protein
MALSELNRARLQSPKIYAAGDWTVGKRQVDRATRAEFLRAPDVVADEMVGILISWHAPRWRVTTQPGDHASEVGLGAVTTPSDVLQSQVVVHSLAQLLLAPEIALSCLNRCVSKQKLNLLKFAASQMA